MLAAPVEGDGSGERMFERCAGALVFEVGALQGEVPLGGLVGVVDEHERGIVFESLGLLDHGALILADEARAEEHGDLFGEGDVEEDVPRGVDVDASVAGRGGRDGGDGAEPIFSAANLFGADVGKLEVDHGGDRLSVHAEQFVGGGVGGRCVGGHAEAEGNGFEVFGLLVDAAFGAPPPRLMDEGAVGGVHESDDAVVDVAGEVGGEMGGGEFR